MSLAAIPYDFRQPQPYPPEVQRALRAWLTVFLTQWGDYCRREMHLATKLRLDALRRAYVEPTLADLPDAVLAYPVQWSSTASSLLVVSRRLALAWTLARLGEKCEALPTDRALTLVETTLWEHLLDHAFLAVARDSWASEPAPIWQRGPRELAPPFTPIFRQQPALLLAELRAEEPFADGFVLWLLSEAVVRQFFAATATGLAASSPASPPRLEELLQDVPLQLTVQLGAVQLPLAQLQQLRTGDVLLLEQRLEEPVLVLLEGTVRYTAWPGRIGSQRAVQIAATREE